MVDNEVKVEETNVDTTENKFEVPESFREKFKDNPDKAIEQLYKAQHTIINSKKAEKTEDPAETKGMDRDQLEKFYAEKKFFEDNSHLSEHKEDILSFTSKGLSFEDARLLVEKKDPTIQNRAIAQKTNFTSGTPDFSSSTYTMEELGDMKQHDYNKAMEEIESGKANLIK